MLGNNFGSYFLGGCFKIKVLSNFNSAVNPLEFCLIGRDVSYIIEQLVRDGTILPPAIQYDCFAQRRCILGRRQNQTHRDFFLQEKIV